MLFDTDVLVWLLRGNKKEAACVEADPAFLWCVSGHEP